MRPILVLGMIGGLALLAALLLHFGVADIFHAVAELGWGGLAAIVSAHLLLIGCMGTGWWVLGRGRTDARWRRFVWGRLVRESASEALPLSQIGGLVLGARAAALAGVAGTFAAASMVVDVTVEMVSQIGYTLVGLLLLWRLRPHSALLLPVLGAVCVMVLLAVAFIAVQSRGAAAVERVLARVAQGWLGGRPGAGTAAHVFIRQMHHRPRVLALSLAIHSGTWLLNGGEAWLALRLIGVRVGIAEALVIDSLLYAIRSAAFFVPNALGIQEGGYVMLGGLFGVPPEAALALSLIRRGRDLLIGVPTLLAWQALEGRRVLYQPSPATPASAPAASSQSG
ncbi:MAG TPA: lysylphosphatidylglycerol synthase domain-containing protein [Acetobacteraceae bacterium]|jgi:putative membrane protein|nr:lysylphosphatidylglycerol synthase domain-containing protein [Acetobacteraceae bacterium]